MLINVVLWFGSWIWDMRVRDEGDRPALLWQTWNFVWAPVRSLCSRTRGVSTKFDMFHQRSYKNPKVLKTWLAPLKVLNFLKGS